MFTRSMARLSGLAGRFEPLRRSTVHAMSLTVIGDHEARTVQQLERCVRAEDGAAGVLCADGHVGYSQPVGGAVAYRSHISVSGVGYDIGCGNKAVRTVLRHEDVAADLPRIMDTIVERISFGVGRHNDEPVDHPVLDAIRSADVAPQRALLDLAAKQLGTVGAGNHYVDLFADEEGVVWIGVHFGSRGFGHKTATTYLQLAGEPGGGMDAAPTLLRTDSELGQEYVAAMNLAGDYAYAGRDVVVDRVLEILGTAATFSVHNNHNFASKETHGGDEWWVVRKGCTPAFPGQQGFVGSTMGETSVILEGADTPAARAAFFSTVHGAGRRLSRTQAAGKMGVVFECSVRDCEFSMTRGEHRAAKRPHCPLHPGAKLLKRRRRVKPGLIDYDQVRADLRGRGIELRGGAADEAPDAYKRLDQVLAEHGDSIRVLHRLTPIGVAMAGPDIHDPYKD
jgi:tRNA-splicing ligase RtcB (3'-phosphate/5'-hydroxy nucleic acid ligase)